jgi:hypothetical protein
MKKQGPLKKHLDHRPSSGAMMPGLELQATKGPLIKSPNGVSPWIIEQCNRRLYFFTFRSFTERIFLFRNPSCHHADRTHMASFIHEPPAGKVPATQLLSDRMPCW